MTTNLLMSLPPSCKELIYPTADVLLQIVTIVQFTFNFCKKISMNMELLWVKVGCMHCYGITINPTQQALILLANTDAAASEDWGHEFRAALQTIRRHFNCNHAHDKAGISMILTKLAGPDSV